MSHRSSSDEAAEHLRLALPLMARYQIPVTPQNYAVWYDYVAGVNEPLKQSIDDMMMGDGSLTEDFIEDLYHRFVINPILKKLAQARESIRSLLEEIDDGVANSDGEVTRYEASLAGYSSRLEADIGSAELRTIIERLADETKSVRETGARLHERLEQSRQEAEALRKELEQARHEATTDALTGLANRKAFYRALEQLTNAAVDGDETLCLLVADIDHFKNINDSYGHLLGDKVIRYIGSIINDCVKGKDLVARYGGEEYAVLLPDTAYQGALAVAESVRQSIERGRLVRSDTRERIGTVTVSIGVTEFRPGESQEDFIGRADEALYRAKQAGRNRVSGEPESVATAV